MHKTEVLNLKELFCAAGQIDLILYKQFESQAFYCYPILTTTHYSNIYTNLDQDVDSLWLFSDQQ